ncbi:hypothetical protein FIA58_003465 [Flavobacterium jejuense]|uniref:Uncharacterized protein n=1 Tax=Flavobacterium jejuense TaxID=1544455 RepID=A0ABX0ILQ7_9FLAO|nr:hypothetical protein [Flavobacterium jejuense]NHN24725.1 hypothetical protein [Flavobacterium jejuense]
MILVGIIFLCTFIIGNFGFHFYYKNKRVLLFNEIGNRDYVEIKNIETEIYSSNKMSVTTKFYISEIILFEGNLFILLKKSFFGDLIIKNYPIIQISRNENSKKYDGVLRKHVLKKSEFVNTKIRFYTNHQIPIKLTTELELNFANKNKELKIVTEFINEKLN